MFKIISNRSISSLSLRTPNLSVSGLCQSSQFSQGPSPSWSKMEGPSPSESERPTRRLLCIANHCKAKSMSTGNHGPPKLTKKALAQGSVCPPTTPGAMRLYDMRFCPFAQRTRIVLEYKKIPYEIVNVNLKYKPDWFLQKNPLGLVPIIEKDDHVIYESTACNEWLDDMYPEGRLQSDDPDRKASDRMLLEFFGQLSTDLMYRLLKRPENRETYIQKVKKHFQHYEDVLIERGGPFFGGSKVAMIDFFLWPHMERIPALTRVVPEIEITPSEYPTLTNWYKHMYERPEVKSTVLDTDTHLHFLMSLAAGKPDYDYGLDRYD